MSAIWTRDSQNGSSQAVSLFGPDSFGRTLQPPLYCRPVISVIARVLVVMIRPATERVYSTKKKAQGRGLMSVDTPITTLPRTLRGEMVALLALGGPMALTQIIQFSIYTIDTIMIARVGTISLAAAAVGGVVYFMLWMVGAGPVSAVTPMVSQALGTTIGDTSLDARTDVRRSVRMSLWLIFGLLVPMLAILIATEPVLLILGQDPRVAKLAGEYVLMLGPGLPMALGVMALRNFLAALNKTMIPLLLVSITVGINAGLNALLIFGLFGFPELGLVGAGIASSISYILCFFMFAAYINLDREARTFEIFRNMFGLDRERLIEVMKLSWPISLTTIFEGALFNSAVLIMGVIGIRETAAYNVSLNVVALAFMLPWGLSMAGAVRIGLAEGAADISARKRVAQATLLISVGIMSLIAIFIAVFPGLIAHAYMDADNPENTATIALILLFLQVASTFMIFDAAQVASNQLLRGLKDVKVPMFITGISYWLIGFLLCYGLALHTPLGALGVWYGLIAGLFAAFIGLGIRLWRQLQIPPRPPELLDPSVPVPQ